MLKRAPFIMFAGLVSGAIVAYGLARGEPDGLVAPALAAAVILAGAWLTVSLLLGKLSGLRFTDALELAVLPFMSLALPLVLFLPFARYEAPTETARFELAGFYPQLLPLATQTLIALAAAVALVLALLAWRFPLLRRGPLNAAAAHPRITLALLITLWAAGAIFLDVAKAMNLNGAANIAMFTDALRNIDSADGPLYSTLFQADGASLLGVHASLIWYLVYPLFSLWPEPQWLLAISDVILALAAVPVYLLARRHFGAGTALLLACVYLGSRLVIGSPGAGELTETRFLPLFFISAFYFWHERRYLPFVFFSLVALTIREDVGVVLAILGLLSLLSRRKWQWWLPVIVVGAAWTLIMVKWLIPSMNPAGEATRVLIIYGSFGDSIREIVTNIIRDPGLLTGVVFSTAASKVAAYLSWQSLGFGIPLLSGAAALALPAAGELFLSVNAYSDHINMPAIAATAFPALVLALAGVHRYAVSKGRSCAVAGLVIVILFTNIALTYSWFSPSWYQQRYNYDAAVRILDMLPADATVYLPMSMTPRAQPDQKVYSYYQVPYEQDLQGALEVEQDYVVIDLQLLPFYRRYYEGMVDLFYHVEGSGAFELVYEQDGLRLYRRVGGDEPEPPERPPALG